MGLKIGCAVWTLMPPPYQPPYEDTLSRIAEMGFDATELYLRSREDLISYWTAENTASIRSLLSEKGLTLSQFCLFQNLAGGLASLDENQNQVALQNVKDGCRLAKELGAKALCIVAPWPEDITVHTTASLPEYFYINVPAIPKPGTGTVP